MEFVRSYGAQNKHQILPYTTLKERFLWPRWRVFTAWYSQSPYVTQICFVFKRLMSHMGPPTSYLCHYLLLISHQYWYHFVFQLVIEHCNKKQSENNNPYFLIQALSKWHVRILQNFTTMLLKAQLFFNLISIFVANLRQPSSKSMYSCSVKVALLPLHPLTQGIL